MAQSNGATIRAEYEAFNRRDLDAATSASSEDMKWVNLPFGQTYRGQTGMKDYLNSWLQGFPDGRVEVVNLVDSGDFVVCEIIGRGTHTGPLNGPAGQIPATGKRAELPMCEVFHFRGGRIVEGRTYFDVATMMRQLGLL